MTNTNRDQLMKVARNCTAYKYEQESSLRSDVKILGETTRSCENCRHFTEDHQCNIDLIDEILTDMAMELDDKY